MKKTMFVLVILALLAIPTVALAKGGGTETGHYSWRLFQLEQGYIDWGPACYYHHQPVYVFYEATNTWTYVVKGDDVRETLVQTGTAKIYELLEWDTDAYGNVVNPVLGDLLDERAFHVTERFFDAGTDVAIRQYYGTSVWYQVSHNPYSPDLEEYQYIWKIPGVYDFRVWNRSGDLSWGWVSGDCEASDWPPHPPHPPHPFSK